MLLAALAGLPEPVHEIELVQQGGRNRHGPVDAPAALFEDFEDERPAGEITPAWGERERLRNAAADIIHHPRALPA